MKSIIALDPKGRVDARDFGKMVGVIVRGVVFCVKEAEPKLGKEGLLNLSKSEEQKIESTLGIEILFSIVSKKFNRPVKNTKQLLNEVEHHAKTQAAHLLEATKTIFLHLWKQSLVEQYKFLRGIAEGFGTFLDNRGEFTGDRGRTNLYFDLLALWPKIAEMQKAEPAKSRRDLQKWLSEEARIPMKNDDEWFDHFCDEIGLVMKGVGRKAHPEV